jgi:hypothetical protein
MNVPGFDFHSLQGFNPKRYSVHLNGPWCITFEFEDGEACRVEFEQYHKGATMASAANRCKNHCPTHPGALLRDDVLPATAGPKRKSPDCSGFRASVFTTSCRKESGIASHRGSARQAFWRWRGNLYADAGRLRHVACGVNRGRQSYPDH